MFRVSVDVGGTFTDLVALDEETGAVENIKVTSVPRNPERGVTDALLKWLEGHKADQVRLIGHATTIATNALLGQVDLEVPKVALITTKGFRDVVEIARQRRAEVYNLFFQRPPQLVERRLRFEVAERVEHDGAVSVALDEVGLSSVLNEIGCLGVSSIAISFLNSYANPIHEERVLVLAKERGTAPYLTASSRISNEYREYERTSTAVVNAALMPIIHKYLTQLAEDLHRLGVEAPLYVMQSNGGLSTAANVSEKPATIVESGPAAGVIAAAWLSELADAGDIISFDMGGTTAKAGTVRGRMPEVVPEYEVAGHIHMGRLVKGSGYPVRFPFIDLAECSSGGGTIAWADKGGALRVGPISAGAYPGPACYGRGGTQPTITDANLLLGRLNPGSLLSGGMSIYPEKGRAALEELGVKIGLGTEETAVSIIRVANSMMGKILRIVSVERGYDPRDFTLVAFGGAGPMHVCPLAEELEISKIIVPPNPGMFSALGLLTADLFHDYVRPVVRRVSAIDPTLNRGGVSRDGGGGKGNPRLRRRPRRQYELPPPSRPPLLGTVIRAHDTRPEECRRRVARRHDHRFPPASRGDIWLLSRVGAYRDSSAFDSGRLGRSRNPSSGVKKGEGEGEQLAKRLLRDRWRLDEHPRHPAR